MDTLTNKERVINDILLVQKQLSNPKCVIINSDGRIFHSYSKSEIEMADHVLTELLNMIKRSSKV